MCNRGIGTARGDGGHGEAMARLSRHRDAFRTNPALRSLYQEWYQQIRDALPDPSLGPCWEVGSGPGFSRDFIADLILSDLVAAPWLDVTSAADGLPVRDGALRALVLFDVLHHLANPVAFFDEAIRALAPGGRLIICDPLVSLASYPVYRYLHEEGLDTRIDPFVRVFSDDKDPFAGNQAVASIMLLRRQKDFHARFPELRIVRIKRFAGFSYPSSGGFNRRPLLPYPLWRIVHALDRRLPEPLFSLMGFRLLAVIERQA